MINKKRQGFTLAEALVTLVIMSLVLAATIPIVRTASNQPAEAPWKYVVRGNLINNNAVYTAPENNALTVMGDNRIPFDDGINEGDLPTIFSSQINPKIAVVTQTAKEANPVISRHLVDFYEKSGTNKHKSIGKISFDRNFNLAIGTNSLDTTVRGASANVASPNDTNGWYKLGDDAKGAANTAVGQYSMAGEHRYISKDTDNSYRTLTGVENSSLGAFSLQSLTTGNYNVAIGSYAMQMSKTSDANIAIGSSSMGNTEGTCNIAIGVNALLGSKIVSDGNTLGKVQGNVAIGYNALVAAHNETSGTANTNGSYNISIGANTMTKITSGKDNVAIGNNAMNNYGAESSSNVVIGSGNGGGAASNKCTHNTILGYSAMPAITSGTSNVAIGFASLYANTTGYNNIAIGNNSLQSNTTGFGNIAIGSSVGTSGNGNNKLYIGGFMDGNAVRHTGTNALIYGDMENRKLTVNGDFTISGTGYIQTNDGMSKIVTEADLRKLTYMYQAGATLTGHVGVPDTGLIISDARLKNISGDNTAGLKEITQLKVKNFTYKNDKKKTPHVGVIAQDLQKVFPHSVFQDGLSKYFKISREEIFWACVNAIKELNEKIQDVVAKIAGLDEKIKILESKNKMYEEKITNLEHKNKLYEERLQAIEFQIEKQLESNSQTQTKLEDVKAE